MDRLLRMYSQLTSLLDRDRAEKENESESSFQVVSVPLEYSRANPWDKWRKVRKIGGGANGSAVFLVHSLRNKQNKCALKRIPYKRTNEPAELLREEGRIMAMINSPYCIALKAAYEDDRSLYLVMELARSGDLYSAVMRRRKRFGEDEAAHIFKQVLHALSDLHRLGIVHRDVKVVNVLVMDERSLSVKLGDFGLACAIGHADDYELCGTHCYMSPETLAHKRVGYPVDMWALGVTLYEVICGKRPFCSEDEVSEHHHEAVIDVNNPAPAYSMPVFTRKNPSPVLIDLLCGLLEPMPRRRLTADEALDHDFILRTTRPGYDPRSKRASAGAPALVPVAAVGDDNDDDDDDDDDDDEFRGDDSTDDDDELDDAEDDEDGSDDDKDDKLTRKVAPPIVVPSDANADNGTHNGDNDDDDDDEESFEPTCTVCQTVLGKAPCIVCTVCDEMVHTQCAGLEGSSAAVAAVLREFVCQRCRQESTSLQSLQSQHEDVLRELEGDDADVAAAAAAAAAAEARKVPPHRTRPRTRRQHGARAATADELPIEKIDELPPSDTSTDAADEVARKAAVDLPDDSSLDSVDDSIGGKLSREQANVADRWLQLPSPDQPDAAGGRVAISTPTKAQRFAILNRNERLAGDAAAVPAAKVAPASPPPPPPSSTSARSAPLKLSDKQQPKAKRRHKDDGIDHDAEVPDDSEEYVGGDDDDDDDDDVVVDDDDDDADDDDGGGGGDGKKRKRGMQLYVHGVPAFLRRVSGFPPAVFECVKAGVMRAPHLKPPSDVHVQAFVSLVPVFCDSNMSSFAERCKDLYAVLAHPASLFVDKQPPKGSTTNLLGEIESESGSAVRKRRASQRRVSSMRAAEVIKTIAVDEQGSVDASAGTRAQAAAAAVAASTRAPASPPMSSPLRTRTTARSSQRSARASVAQQSPVRRSERSNRSTPQNRGAN